jgi:hypothetical protein
VSMSAWSPAPDVGSAPAKTSTAGNEGGMERDFADVME